MSKLDRFDSLIKYYAQKNGLDFAIVKRQVFAESYDPELKDLDPAAESPTGARGLMQFMPETWEQWGTGNILNPEDNIAAGCKYDAYLYSKFKEIPDPEERILFALASYNAGRGNINTMLAHARDTCDQPESYLEWKKLG